MPASAYMGRGLPVNISFTLAIAMESLIHGIYTMLFISAVPVMFKGCTPRLMRRVPSTMIFPLSAVSMYIISTVHLVLALHSFIKAYIVVSNPSLGFENFWVFSEWDAFLGSILACIMTWIGDALVIYRCYCVWNDNFPLIILPLLLLAGSFAVNIYSLVWFQHPLSFSMKSEIMSFNAVFPLNLIQNVVTTGLIALKIWNQHRQSSAMRVVDRSSRLSLIRIIRIIIESAMIYTVQLFILIVLYFRGNNFQHIMQFAIVPSTGIVFVLITLRIYHTKKQSPEIGSSLGVIPASWLRDTDSEGDVSQQDSISVQDVASLTVKNEAVAGNQHPTSP